MCAHGLLLTVAGLSSPGWDINEGPGPGGYGRVGSVRRSRVCALVVVVVLAKYTFTSKMMTRRISRSLK